MNAAALSPSEQLAAMMTADITAIACALALASKEEEAGEALARLAQEIPAMPFQNPQSPAAEAQIRNRLDVIFRQALKIRHQWATNSQNMPPR